ncbi:hypothetical protein ACIRRH_39385 [Kitasatospora sp. NPDC101235]
MTLYGKATQVLQGVAAHVLKVAELCHAGVREQGDGLRQIQGDGLVQP